MEDDSSVIDFDKMLAEAEPSISTGLTVSDLSDALGPMPGIDKIGEALVSPGMFEAVRAPIVRMGEGLLPQIEEAIRAPMALIVDGMAEPIRLMAEEVDFGIGQHLFEPIAKSMAISYPMAALEELNLSRGLSDSLLADIDIGPSTDQQVLEATFESNELLRQAVGAISDQNGALRAANEAQATAHTADERRWEQERADDQARHEDQLAESQRQHRIQLLAMGLIGILTVMAAVLGPALVG